MRSKENFGDELIRLQGRGTVDGTFKPMYSMNAPNETASSRTPIYSEYTAGRTTIKDRDIKIDMDII